jgi:hypothetical protein
VNAPVFATHGICISTYATPGLGKGIGGLTDFSFPVANPPAERLAESKKVYASDFEDAIDEVIEELVAAERKMTMKNHSIRQPRTDTMEDVNRSTKRFIAVVSIGGVIAAIGMQITFIVNLPMVAANAALGASYPEILHALGL